MALTAYEDSLCGGCAQPKDVVYNPDADGWFEAEEIVCAGCAAQQKRTGQNDKKPTPGAKVFVVDTRPADLELMPWQLPSRGSNGAADPETVSG